MAHDRPAVLDDQRVHRIDGLGVGVVDPRAEDAQAAQLAAILVRDDVVGVVGPRAFVLEAFERRAFERGADDHAVGPVLVAVGTGQLLVDVGGPHRAAVPVGQTDRGVLADDQVFAAQASDLGLRHVVAERVEQPRHHRLGAGAQFRLTGRVELEEIAVAADVGDRESRGDAVRLAADGPGAGLRPRIVAGPAEHLVGGERAGADAVGEPARVRYLVDRIDALGAAHGRKPGPSEEIDHRVVGERDFTRRHLRGILRVRRPGDGIVVEEPGGGALRRGRHQRRAGDEERNERASRQCAHDHRPTGLNARMMRNPSRLWATSSRSAVVCGPWRRTPKPTSLSSPEKSRSSRLATALPAS